MPHGFHEGKRVMPGCVIIFRLFIHTLYYQDKACIHAVCLPLGGGCGTHFCFRCAKYSADDATSIYRHQGTCLGTSYKTLRNFEKINLDDFNVSDQIFPLHRIRDTRKPPPKVSKNQVGKIRAYVIFPCYNADFILFRSVHGVEFK